MSLLIFYFSKLTCSEIDISVYNWMNFDVCVDLCSHTTIRIHNSPKPCGVAPL